MKYTKSMAAIGLICAVNCAFSNTSHAMPGATGNFINWQSLPSVPAMTVGTTYNLSYSVVNNNFAPSLPLSISVSHAEDGSTPTITSNTCGSLNIGSTCSFTVRITPTSDDIAEGINDVVSVSYPGRGSPLTSTISADVTGVTATLTGPTYSQVTSQVSGIDQVMSYTFTNTSSLTINSITISGISTPETVSTTCGSSLAPSGSCTINVEFSADASEIGTTVPAATLSVNYGGSAAATAPVAAITVIAPMLGLAGESGIVSIWPSSDLTASVTTLWNTATLATSDTFHFSSILGLTTYNSNGQLLNPTLIVGGNNSINNDQAIVFSTDNGTTWQQANSLPSAPSSLYLTGFAYDSASGKIMTAGCTNNSAFCTGVPSMWYATDAYNGQTSWSLASGFSTATVMTPFALAYANGYFVSALAIFSAGTFSSQRIAYGTSPTTSWTIENLSLGSGYIPSSLAYANNTWVLTVTRAASGSAGAIYYSTVADNSPPTGASWTAATGTFVRTMGGVVYDPVISKFIAVGYTSGNIVSVYTSSDGITWSSGSVIASNFQVKGIIYSETTGVVVITGINTGSGTGGVLFNTGSDMTTGWTAMSNVTLGSNYGPIASSTQSNNSL